MRIAIIGSGGVGGYFGGRLAAAGADVTFIARGAHLHALRTTGLRIESPDGHLSLPHVNASEDTAEMGPVDVVLFTVKMYDLQAAAALLPPLLGADTVVIPLQNGVESVAALTAIVDRRHVAGGTVYINSTLVEPGLIRHIALGRMIFGELDGESSPRLEELLALATAAGISATLSNQIEVEVWSKFVRLTVLSGMTTVTRQPIGVIRDDPDLYAMWQAALLESIAVARGRHVPLPRALFEEINQSIQALPSQSKSSMLEDLEHGRRLELPWLSGAVVRMAQDIDIDTPIHRFITTVLGPYVNGRAETRLKAVVA